MAAIFYKFKQDNAIFKDSITLITAVSIPILNSLNADNYAAITGLSTQNSETIQYFLTFDDAISYFYYGKGLGNLMVEGLLFTDCSDVMPGLQEFHSVIGRNRGKDIVISLGTIGMVGVLDNYSLEFAPEEQLAKFGLRLTIIDHTLRQFRAKPVC